MENKEEIRDVEGNNLPSQEEVEWANLVMNKLLDNVKKVIIGKDEQLKAVLTTFCARGHVLLEDFPGVGKTQLARAFARSLGVDEGRVQYTPDVVPADVTGAIIFSRQDEEFKFRPGPVFTNVLLADEINRGTPRTQSSLLEAMEERNVTVEGTCYNLPEPFFVIATQNPLEVHGTFPLPESQLDRFMVKISMGYPDRDTEEKMLISHANKNPLDVLESVTDEEALAALMDITSRVYLGPKSRSYLISLISEIRADSRVKMGVSPRGTLSIARAARAKALIEGRDSVIPDDVQKLAVVSLAHRVIPYSHSDSSEDLVRECLSRVPVPAS